MYSSHACNMQAADTKTRMALRHIHTQMYRATHAHVNADTYVFKLNAAHALIHMYY